MTRRKRKSIDEKPLSELTEKDIEKIYRDVQRQRREDPFYDLMYRAVERVLREAILEDKPVKVQ